MNFINILRERWGSVERWQGFACICAVGGFIVSSTIKCQLLQYATMGKDSSAVYIAVEMSKGSVAGKGRPVIFSGLD